MKIQKIQKNKVYPNCEERRGFVILFAVMLSSIILAITLGVSNISLKEINFSTSAKDANDAFFAADTGVECALFNDKGTLFTDTNINADIPSGCLLGNSTFSGSFPTWIFDIIGLGSTGRSCAKITINKDPVLGTVITSKGYSADSSTSDDILCTPGSRAVERELEVTY
ncbi:MAG: hypothetical protein WA101_02405 [Minisyncoccia bacterium]